MKKRRIFRLIKILNEIPLTSLFIQGIVAYACDHDTFTGSALDLSIPAQRRVRERLMRSFDEQANFGAEMRVGRQAELCKCFS